jgi:hypothetical protein
MGTDTFEKSSAKIVATLERQTHLPATGAYPDVAMFHVPRCDK